MKKLFSFLLILVIAFSICCSIPAFAEEEEEEAVKFTLSTEDNTDDMKIGDVVRISVSMPEVSLRGAQGRLIIDSDYLEVVTDQITYAPGIIKQFNSNTSSPKFGEFIYGATSAATETVLITVPLKVTDIPNVVGGFINVTLTDVKYVPPGGAAVEAEGDTLQLGIGISSKHQHTTDDANHFAAVTPNCQRGGNIEYWRCNVCTKLFSDEDMTQEVEVVTLPIGDHDYQHVEAAAPTETDDGNIEYWQCSVCSLCFSTANGKKTDGSSSQISYESTILDATGTTTVNDGILGDVNGDGRVTAKDMLALRRFLLNKSKNPMAKPDLADCNLDDRTTAKDLLALRRYLINKRSQPQIGVPKPASP